MKTGFVVCNSYSKELKFVIEKLKLPDIETLIVSSTCGSPNIEERASFAKKRNDFEQKVERSNILMSQSCIGCGNEKDGYNNDHFICPSFCLENFVPPQLLNHYIENKYYIITTGWLSQWKHTVINRWKFDKETASLFFNDAAKEILVIDTGIYSNYEIQLKEFSEFVNLKYTILPFGIEYFEKKLEAIIYKRQQQKSDDDFLKFKKEVNQKISEYAMIIDLIPSLSTINSEKLVIGEIVKLFTILFVPEKISYVKNNENNEKVIVLSDDKNFSIDEVLAKCSSEESCFINENKQGFITKINFKEKIYGYILIENILFPQYLSRYVNFSESLIPFFGLLISNSRQYEELEELNNEYESLLEEQKQNIEEITTLNDCLLEKNEKLDELNATKDKFFSIIAHDLKNPFNAILGFSDLLLKNSSKYTGERINYYAQIINQTTKHTFELLENLLEWARIQRDVLVPKTENVKPSYIVNETISLCDQMLRAKNIDLQTNLYCDEFIRADNEMLKTIIRNLLTNAIKFSNTNGEITIETQKSEMNIVFKISDKGIGIKAEDINKLFKIDSKISRVGTANETGTGLGLLLCKEFVEKQGGEIWVESEVGIGSSFRFTLPISSAYQAV